MARLLECSPMARETRVQSQVESYQRLKKMALDASLLNTQHYKVWIKGKVEQPREGVAPSHTPWCSSYRKGSLRVTLDYGRQLYLLIYIYIYIYIYICVCVCVCVCVFSHPTARARCDTRSIFRIWIKSFHFLTPVEIPRLKSPVCSTILPIVKGRIVWFLTFP